MLHLTEIGQLLGPAALGGNPVELMELVAVPVGREKNAAVRPHRNRAHGVLREHRQLLGPAAVDRDRPEVELAGDVRDEEDALPIRRELRDRVEPAERKELLERWAVGHAGTLQPSV